MLSSLSDDAPNLPVFIFLSFPFVFVFCGGMVVDSLSYFFLTMLMFAER